ncbi:hypothetical protein BD410DRAFT_840846 [Rickenella mellea]|uniref:Uncharacterized protein n=1 Tax=Rickenella mellea TaxID=50990 RepID=A0A4Y7Q2Y5_9AGAM|nr:hypothetical protein BD410DRAFT_840846 [Rickenella mellea]
MALVTVLSEGYQDPALDNHHSCVWYSTSTPLQPSTSSTSISQHQRANAPVRRARTTTATTMPQPRPAPPTPPSSHTACKRASSMCMHSRSNLSNSSIFTHERSRVWTAAITTTPRPRPAPHLPSSRTGSRTSRMATHAAVLNIGSIECMKTPHIEPPKTPPSRMCTHALVLDACGSGVNSHPQTTASPLITTTTHYLHTQCANVPIEMRGRVRLRTRPMCDCTSSTMTSISTRWHAKSPGISTHRRANAPVQRATCILTSTTSTSSISTHGHANAPILHAQGMQTSPFNMHGWPPPPPVPLPLHARRTNAFIRHVL